MCKANGWKLMFFMAPSTVATKRRHDQIFADIHGQSNAARWNVFNSGYCIFLVNEFGTSVDELFWSHHFESRSSCQAAFGCF